LTELRRELAFKEGELQKRDKTADAMCMEIKGLHLELESAASKVQLMPFLSFTFDVCWQLEVPIAKTTT
jgi:hypothetical protein